MNVTFTTDGISAYVRDLASRYDTVGKTRSFTTPTGKAATVSGGTYGWSIDEPAEIEQLKQILPEESRYRESLSMKNVLRHLVRQTGAIRMQKWIYLLSICGISRMEM